MSRSLLCYLALQLLWLAPQAQTTVDCSTSQPIPALADLSPGAAQTFTLCPSDPSLRVEVDFFSYSLYDQWNFFWGWYHSGWVQVDVFDGPPTGTLLQTYPNGAPVWSFTSSDPSGCISYTMTYVDQFCWFFGCPNVTGNTPGADLQGNASCPTALPVSYVSFGGEPVADGTNHLTWVTARETNHYAFVVEKSPTGTDRFGPLGTVLASEAEVMAENGREAAENGKGTNLSGSNYHRYNFSDPAPFQKTYYRLRQQDYDMHTVSRVSFPKGWPFESRA